MGGTFKCICSECGMECEVPFEPIAGRPIKCNSCYRKGWGKGNLKNKKRDIEVICAECGKETTVPFKPVQGRPVLCRECFKKEKENRLTE